jgi:gliding motility-associated-like protein
MTNVPPAGINRLLSHALLTAGLLVLIISRCDGQYENLATMNYSNLSLNRLGNIPGVTWVPADNTTYDANHQRFFFQGNATSVPPYNLYTVNAVSGAVIYNPVCPSPAGTSGFVSGLQYDNATDTLYAIYQSGSSASFCWVAPATGVVTTISTLSGFAGYNFSTFDTRDHWYICVSGEQLWVINAATGAVLSNPAFSPTQGIAYPLFDNLTGHLYGIGSPSSLSHYQFDSVSLTNGTCYPIANLPPMTLPDLGAAAIDEAAGKYIFVGNDPFVVCVTNYLYLVDIGTGVVLSKKPYPYAESDTIINDENVIGYSFDNKRETLYVLNWYPPQSQLGNLIQIAASNNRLCPGSTDTFTAATPPGLTNLSYQWQWNGNNVGVNNPSYTNGNLADGDSVRCIITISQDCALPVMYTTNSILIHVLSPPAVSVTITASPDNVCGGDTIVFTAIPVNGGSVPAYQWQVDGVNTGANSALFATNALSNGDEVDCLLTSSVACAQPVPSASISPLIRPTPTISISVADTVIPYGQEVSLRTTVDTPVTSYQWMPATGLNDPSIADPVASPVANTVYQVSVLAPDGCTAKAAVDIKVYHPLRMPNAFTPNGDGRNDVFRIPAFLQIILVNFSVYNRWGERVFSTANSAEGWDGTLNGRFQPAGAYVWRVEYQDLLTGRPAVASGTVMMIR